MIAIPHLSSTQDGRHVGGRPDDELAASACCLRPDEDGGHAGPSGDLQICSELSVYLPIVPTVSDKSSSKIFF